MAWCALKPFNVPMMKAGGGLSHRTPLAIGGFGCASVVATCFWRSSCSSSRYFAPPFASLSIASSSSKKEAVMTEKAPAALGPYSQAIKVNNLDLFLVF